MPENKSNKSYKSYLNAKSQLTAPNLHKQLQMLMMTVYGIQAQKKYKYRRSGRKAERIDQNCTFFV